MSIRIQPPEIPIPDDDPFANDLLDRKKQADILTRVVQTIEGPCAIAVDAAWGAGKTTFLKMWAQQLRGQGFPVVEFNAWETDYSGDPFVSLTSEITKTIDETSGHPTDAMGEKAKRQALDLVRKAAPGVIRMATSFIPVVGSEVGNVLGSIAEQKLAGYQQAQQSVGEFKLALETLADTLWEFAGQKPLVVFIDELDRCRPSYAIELLETGKHIFAVNHVVFVIAVNRSELSHSVKVLYGNDFGADGYLRRFFDMDFRLPEPDRRNFIQQLLVSGGFYQYLKRTGDRFAVSNGGLLLTVMQTFLGESEISLRECGQAIHRFGLVLSSLAENERAFARTLAILTIVRSVDLVLYRKMVAGQTTDEEIVDQFFALPGYQSIRYTEAGQLAEAVMIAGRTNARELGFRREELAVKSPLLHKYLELVGEFPASEHGGNQVWQQAYAVVDLVHEFHSFRGRGGEPLGFQESVDRFELLSPDLIGNASPT